METAIGLQTSLKTILEIFMSAFLGVKQSVGKVNLALAVFQQNLLVLGQKCSNHVQSGNCMMATSVQEVSLGCGLNCNE